MGPRSEAGHPAGRHQRLKHVHSPGECLPNTNGYQNMWYSALINRWMGAFYNCNSELENLCFEQAYNSFQRDSS